jgi:hypothetical protein
MRFHIVGNMTPMLALDTILIAIIGAIIAYEQFRLAKQKLKLELFEKRYKVFEATRKFLSVILRETSFKDSDLFEFYAGTSDATFLFEKDITTYLDSIRDHALKMRALHENYAQLPTGEARTQLVDKETTELNWLTGQLVLAKDNFYPYLGFSTVK